MSGIKAEDQRAEQIKSHPMLCKNPLGVLNHFDINTMISLETHFDITVNKNSINVRHGSKILHIFTCTIVVDKCDLLVTHFISINYHYLLFDLI